MSMGAANTVTAATQSISSPVANAGTTNGAPARQPDRKAGDAETNAQFGEVLQGIQSKFGARPEKGREIKKTLGKDDFLRIMITQMKNQDPTNPFKAEQMAAEMAQFTSVEQLKNMNETLTKMTTANQPLERMAMTNMIGKTVTIDRGRFPHQEGIPDQVSFGLARDASQVVLSLVDEHGETVLQKDMGKLKAGENTFNWDGKKLNTLPAKSGNYMIRVEAVDPQGQKIDTDSIAQARVIGVSLEGQEPVFLVGDNKQQAKVTMKNIVRVDGDANAFGGAAPAGQGANAGSPGFVSGAALQNGPKAPPSFFTYQKGVGSANFDATTATPEMKEAITRYQANGGLLSGGATAGGPPIPGSASGAPGSPGAPSVNPQSPANHARLESQERGFPNGLHDDPQPSQNEKGGK